MQSLQGVRDWAEEYWPDDLGRLPSRIGQAVYDYTELLYVQLTKYGNPVPLPTLEQIEEHLPKDFLHQLPGIRSLTSAPPPPPPPAPSGVYETAVFWAGKHRKGLYIASGIAAVGFGTLLAHRRSLLSVPGLRRRSSPRRSELRTPVSRNGSRREAIVVIGADVPLGRALALHLSTLGFVVIASVSSHSAVSAFNSIVPPSSRGYIKALQYDTADVAGSLPKFIRSVDEVLRLRFPLLSAGDPYAAPGNEVSLVGVVNALSYLAPTLDGTNNRSQPSFQGSPAELAELLERHIAASLCAISALQSLLVSSRLSPVRSGPANPEAVPASATVISLLSSPVSHTALPGVGIESVISHAIAAGMETMRRETEDKSGRELPSSLSLLPNPLTANPRRTRITTLEIDDGIPWGSAVNPSLTKSVGSSADQEAMPARPSVVRKVSLNGSWQNRDAATQAVLNKVGAILLTPDPSSRLKASYRVYLPGGSDYHFMGHLTAYLNRATQRFLRILPTSWVDLVLALRRNVSLRRAGLISQGPRHNQATSSSQMSSNVDSSVLSQYGRQSMTASGSGQAQSSLHHSRASAHPSTVSSRGVRLGDRAAAERRHQSFSTSSDDGYGDGATSGPPSLPDSNSGDSFPEGEECMVSSGVLSNYASSESSHHQHPRQNRAVSSASTETATGSAYTSGATLPRSASRDGPWMGPSSRNSPLMGPTSVPASTAHSPLVSSDDAEEVGGASAATLTGDREEDSSRNAAILGDSWVRLDESGRRDA